MFLLYGSLMSQIVCSNVEIVPNTGVNADFTFDSFGKYLGGISMNAIATIKVKVDEKTPPDPNCKWLLRMEVDNNPSAGSAAGNWETRASYSPTSSSPIPTIDILRVRVDNPCHTPVNAGIFQTFNNHGDQLDIIQNTGVLVTAGSCVTNTNGPGSFFTNYDEFIFKLDLRITPGYTYRPGIYELKLTFHLEEVP